MTYPSWKDIRSSLEKARGVFKETGSITTILKQVPFITLHEALRIATEERLRERGYRIVGREEAPEDIKATYGPDIIAEKDGRWLLVEVEPIDQLVRRPGPALKLVTRSSSTRW